MASRCHASERNGERLLQHESGIRDTALDEEVELDMGSSPDVQISFNRQETRAESEKAEQLPLVPGVVLRSVKVNTGASPVWFKIPGALP